MTDHPQNEWTSDEAKIASAKQQRPGYVQGDALKGAPEQVRGTTHGDYAQMSLCAQSIKAALHASPNWDKMGPPARESLELMATKIARIVHGDFSCYDHWDDLRGYSQLILDRMIKPKE